MFVSLADGRVLLPNTRPKVRIPASWSSALLQRSVLGDDLSVLLWTSELKPQHFEVARRGPCAVFSPVGPRGSKAVRGGCELVAPVHLKT